MNRIGGAFFLDFLKLLIIIFLCINILDEYSIRISYHFFLRSSIDKQMNIFSNETVDLIRNARQTIMVNKLEGNSRSIDAKTSLDFQFFSSNASNKSIVFPPKYHIDKRRNSPIIYAFMPYIHIYGHINFRHRDILLDVCHYSN